MTSEELKKKVEDLKEKIAKKSDNDHEKKMLKFMSESEQQAYLETKVRMQEYEAKLKKKRDAAVKKQKAEYDFWNQVRERKDEVLKFLSEEPSAENNISSTDAHEENSDKNFRSDNSFSAPKTEPQSTNQYQGFVQGRR